MLVRKKSGEIVKSSLKTQPNQTSTLKSNNVKFNLELDIKTFNGYESPLNISRKNSPVSSAESSPTNSLVNSPNPFNFQDKVDKSCQYFISSHNINLTNTNTNTIYLKSINYYDGKLIGYVNCLNLDFEKKFQIKLTFNNWKSSILFNNNFRYIKSINEYDEFKFEINLNVSKDFELVINYSVANQIYWDNNNGLNYKVTVSKHEMFNHYDYFEDFDYYNLDDYNFNDYDNGLHHEDNASEKSLVNHNEFIDTDYVDTLLNKFVSNRDYNSILQNYCFYNEPSQSYFSLNDEISI